MINTKYLLSVLTTIALLSVLIITGCGSSDNPPDVIGVPNRFIENVLPRVIEEEPPDITPIPFTVLHRVEIAERAMYEPTYGTYIGAWLRDETTPRDFERIIGRSHAVYANEMRLGEEIPITWILHCIASLSTPLIIVHPPEVPGRTVGTDIDVPLNDQIVYLAQRLGAFNLPMFVAFYPSDHGMTAAEYTLLFRYAHAMFMAYAPMIAFVWIAPDATATANSPFFPGHDAVDWVAVKLLAGRDSYNFTQDIIEELEPFYMAFQARHPIMLLPIGVSHRSRTDFVFRIRDAADEIIRVYEAIQYTFPRVRLVIYGDNFVLSPSTNDDFSITVDSNLIKAYYSAINHEHFITNLETNALASERWVRSAFTGYYIAGEFFIDVRTLERELFLSPPFSTEINERDFVETSLILERSITSNTENKVIFIDAVR